MATATRHAADKLPPTPWGDLPPQLRVLFISGPHRTGSWLAQALAGDNASEVVVEEALGVARGLARLRDEAFDAVLVSHEADLDALELLDAIRAGSSDHQPIVVLGEPNHHEMAALCYEAGGDAYVSVHTATIRGLIWEVARSVQRHELIAENRRLRQAHRHRLQLEHEEAARLLEQQRAMIADLEQLDAPPPPAGEVLPDPLCRGTLDLPAPLVDHYHELLRAYVIMGSGNLAAEMSQLAELLAAAGVGAQQAMLLHLRVLEELIRGLGSRSARHVLNRADMLVLEVMINLAERYRTRFLERVHPARQRLLPGFE